MKKTAIQIREDYKKEIEKFFDFDISLEKMEEIREKLANYNTNNAYEVKELKTQLYLIQHYLFSGL